MSIFQESSTAPGDKAILLSIRPKYADLILSGTKLVEFRRSWAASEVSTIVLYSSAPIQKIVGLVKVQDVVVASPSSLWETCKERGGGLTRKELRAYFCGKSKGVAILLGHVLKPHNHIKPSDIIDDFIPPQSFRYLSEVEFNKIKNEMMD